MLLFVPLLAFQQTCIGKEKLCSYRYSFNRLRSLPGASMRNGGQCVHETDTDRSTTSCPAALRADTVSSRARRQAGEGLIIPVSESEWEVRRRRVVGSLPSSHITPHLTFLIDRSTSRQGKTRHWRPKHACCKRVSGQHSLPNNHTSMASC